MRTRLLILLAVAGIACTIAVAAGLRYLLLLLDRYARTDLALAAYNIGPTAVDKAAGVLGPVGMNYVLNVENRWSALAGCS